MSGWMADMAELVDAAEAIAPIPPLTPAPSPESMRTVSVEDAPTEPATSPRMMEVQVTRWPQELQLPTGMIGQREEPEQFPTRFIINDGRWTQEEHEELLRKAAQAWNYRDWNREQHDAALREKEAHERSIQEWEAKVDSQGLKDHPDVPRGPPPKETSSMRVLPNVHEALRQNDPSMAPGSQPAPPSTGRPRPKGFYSDKEPPKNWFSTNAAASATTTSSMGSSASRSISSTGNYSHDSRTSTSSTNRGTSKADANGEPDDQ